MPLSIECTNCKTTLELDEGFRGGVCRCSNCGSLVQVPRAENEGVARVRPSGPGGIPAPNRPANPSGSSKAGDTGLSDPRSGIGSGSSSGLRYPRPVPTATKNSKKRSEKPVAAEKPPPVDNPPPPPQAPARMPTPPAQQAKEIKKNNFMLGVSITLGIIILVVIVVIVGTQLFR